MFDTVAQIAFAITLILPGFLVVQLSERRRPATPAGGDLELILRGLVYALIIQSLAAVLGWLPSLVDDLDGAGWKDHLDAAALYALLVCVAVPTIIGLVLGTALREAEAAGPLRWWHYALGGRDARRAWDYTFSCHNGAWVRVYFKEPGGTGTPAMIGKYGKHSWASQSPAEPDLYLQEVWPADADGQVAAEDLAKGAVGGMWIDGEQIARLEILKHSASNSTSTP
ncbi:MAG TPA: DUF6338 family protein [Solirubrobacteraceae bacterium]|nr:DUF6338 family protein [Solirubrobacteraceae bacterium]